MHPTVFISMLHIFKYNIIELLGLSTNILLIRSAFVLSNNPVQPKDEKGTRPTNCIAVQKRHGMECATRNHPDVVYHSHLFCSFKMLR